jgi:uncharacterized protein (DUF427 family)
MTIPNDPHIAERERWRNVPRIRPAVVVTPGPGQQSVWDYPRPPRLEAVPLPVRVEYGGQVIARTERALRVCETASPPGYYIPPADVDPECLRPSTRTSYCEWKGVARYWTIRVGDRIAKDAAWSYPEPYSEFEALRDYLAFYPGRLDGCFVGDERVEPQPGFYYGGWITRDLVGPFKGVPGSAGW